ncbi:hypothetical protein EMIT0P43_30086 [Pseudomonas jessenii]
MCELLPIIDSPKACTQFDTFTMLEEIDYSPRSTGLPSEAPAAQILDLSISFFTNQSLAQSITR